MVQIRRRQFAAGMGAAGLVTASGLAGRARAQSTPTIRIGSLLPHSGFEALVGASIQEGIDLAKKLLPGMGYSFEIMDADTESKADQARTAAERLIRDGAQILMGAYDSAHTFAVAQVAEQHGIPLVVNVAGDAAITEQGYKYVFRNFQTTTDTALLGVALLSELFKVSGLHPKTAVLMHPTDSMGLSMRDAIHGIDKTGGLPVKIIDEISYDPQARDLSIEIARAKAAKADIHLAVWRLNDAILIVREMVKQRYQPMAVISPSSPGMTDAQFGKALGKYANYIISNVPWLDPKQPMTKTLRDAFAKDYPNEICGIYAGFAWEGVLICADAFKRAKSTQPDALVAALRATNITDRVMLGGPIRFNEKGQNPSLPSAALQMIDGKPTVILPVANAEHAPILPMPAWTGRT